MIRNALEYLDLPRRSPAQIIADCRRLAETCRHVAAQAGAKCNSPVRLYWEQRAVQLEQRAMDVATATGAAL